MQTESTALEAAQATSPVQGTAVAKPRRRVLRILPTICLSLLLLTGGAAYWALDRYVIDHVEIAGVTAYEAAVSGTGTVVAADGGAESVSTVPADSAAATTAVVTVNSYTSQTKTITITQVTTGSGEATVACYVADVVLEDATELRSAFANNQ